MSRPDRALRHRLLALARNFHDDGCLDLAATISYFSLLSLGPLAYLAGVVAGMFFGSGAELERAILSLSPFLPEEAATVLPWLVRTQMELGSGLVWIALPALLWVGSSGFYALERAINRVFASGALRRGWRARLKAFAALGGSVLFMTLALALRAALPLIDSWRQALNLPVFGLPFGRLGSDLLLVLIAFGTFSLIYRLLPSGRASWSSALQGAVVASVLWEAARLVFGILLLRSPSFGLLTGALAGVVTFLVWVYTSSAVVLVGAEWAAIQSDRRPVPR